MTQPAEQTQSLEGGVAPELSKAQLVSVDELVKQTNEMLLAFPEVSYEIFQLLGRPAQKEALSRNRIVGTDTYNRVMDELQSLRPVVSPDFEPGTTVATAPSTFSLQLRRSPHDFLIACGVEEVIEKLTTVRITQAELDFAEEHYKHTANPYFNKAMWQEVIDKYDGKLPIEISGVRDGTVVIPGEPLVNVKGPSEIVAHLEPFFHRVCYQTLVATKARALVEILGDPDRFIEVGLRGVEASMHLDALEAMYIGSGIRLTSNDAAPAILPCIDAGTIGHRYIQSFPTQEASLRHAIENRQAVTQLIDLVDSMDGIDLGIRLQDEYRETGKNIGERLDSGTLEELKDQVRRYITKTNALGLTNPKTDGLVIEGIETLDDIAQLEEMIITEFGPETRARVKYGAGGLMVSENVARKNASSGFKISEYTDVTGQTVATQKFSDSPDKESYPGSPELAYVNGIRTVVQTGEEFEGSKVEPIFELLSTMDSPIVRSTIEEAQKRAAVQYEALLNADYPDPKAGFKSLRAVPSPETAQKRLEVRARYGLAS